MHCWSGTCPPVHETRRVPIGSYCGLKLILEMRKDRHPEMIISGVTTHYLEFRAVAAGTLLNRIDNMIEALPLDAERAREQSRIKARQLKSYTGRIGQAFDQEPRFVRMQEMRHD